MHGRGVIAPVLLLAGIFLPVTLPVFDKLGLKGYSGIQTAVTLGQSPRPSVIIFIGDGMGPNQIELGRLVEYGPDGNSSILQLPFHQFIDTNNVDDTTTDSAAAATAIATGYKTHNYVIGKNAMYQSVPTILELAEARGYATGIIVTKFMNDATPAGFAAHNDNRGNYVDIAADMAYAGIDLLLGGGSSSTYFGTQIASLQANGYTYVTSRAGLAGVAALPVLGLFNAGNMGLEMDRTTASTEPTLTEMVTKGIELLNASGKPFVLLVEGSQIDTCCHANNKVGIAHEVIEFEKAFRYAKSIAEKNNNLQLIVCADHETGGLTIDSYNFITGLPLEQDGLATKIAKRTNRTNEIAVTFSTTGHTSTHVYLAGMGPYTDSIENASHLVDIFQIMRAAVETSFISVSSPPDMTIHESMPGNFIGWVITSTQIDVPTFSVYKNGTLLPGYGNESWSNGTLINVNVDGLPSGTYNFTIIASDNINAPVYDSVIVKVLDDPPRISHPGSLAYEYGTVGNQITWNISDPSAMNGSVGIFHDGFQIFSGSWNYSTTMNVNVDGLGIGVHNYTIKASDGELTSQDSAIVTVFNVDPVISHPADIEYKVNTVGNQIAWFITDLSSTNQTYVIVRDGIVCNTGTWTSIDPVIISLDGLVVARYNFTIIVYDGLGGIAQDDVIVNVTGDMAPAIDDDTYMLGALSFGMSIVFFGLSTTILLIKKKKQRSAHLV
ncbi:MAG: alkaline phosphatase [Candidatus Sigynarchaeota archaeon]